MNPGGDARLPGSFRDPSGYLFRRDGELLRFVSTRYRDDFDFLKASGLLDRLTDSGWLIPHEEVAPRDSDGADAYKILRPEPLAFVSYPWEWSFSQLKDAALHTLRVHHAAWERGLVLKDATAFNVQFHRGRPVFIDTLSFEKYRPGTPWVAYRQFCQHFLAPLALMARRDVRLQQLLRSNIDGIPLDLASALLPARTLFRRGLWSHIWLHAWGQGALSGRHGAARDASIGRFRFEALTDSLESAVAALHWAPRGTVWGEYYSDTNYTPAAFADKQRLVGELLDRVRPAVVWDCGANRGDFSRLAAARGAFTVAMDIDPAAVERNYLRARADGDALLLPLLMDLSNPTPGLGWQHRERESLLARGPADAALALALVHHLAIANNLPFTQIAAFFAAAARSLIVEFVPKSDSQVRRMLASREDVFDRYSEEAFRADFSTYFEIEGRSGIAGSERVLYLLRRRGNPETT